LRNELKNKIRDNYTIIPNGLLSDDVSPQAKCLYALLASKPDDWTFFNTVLAEEMRCTVNSLRKYFSELIDNDWVEKTTQTRKKGMFSTNKYTLKAINLTVRKKTDTVNLPTTKRIVTNKSITNSKELVYIYSFWNEKGIVLHKKLTDKIKAAIEKTLKDYTVDEVTQAITNYAEILTGSQYFFKYTWTLRDFLTRGMDKFSLPAEVVRKNFTGGKNGKGRNNSRKLPKKYTESPDYED